MAMRNAEVSIMPKVFGVGLTPYKTVREFIGHLPPLKAGGINKFDPNHRASDLTPINLKRIQHTPHDGGNRLGWPDELILDCHRNNGTGHTDVYGRMYWDKPAPALTGRASPTGYWVRANRSSTWPAGRGTCGVPKCHPYLERLTP